MSFTSRFLKGLMRLLMLLSVILLIIMGIFLGLNRLAQKNNVNKIVDTCVYSVTYDELKQASKEKAENSGESDDELSIEGYESLGDINDIFNQIAGGNIDLSGLLGQLGNIGEVDLSSGAIGGLSGITSLSGLLNGFKTSETIFDFFLRFIGAKDLFTKEMVKKAIDGMEIDDLNIDYFMKSSLSNHMIVELCYLYYGYISDKSVINTWDADREKVISEVIEEYKKDFAILLNKDYSDIDEEVIVDIKSKLKMSIMEMMPSAQEKVNSMSKIVRTIIGFVFTDVLAKFIIGIVLLLFIIVLLYQKSFKKTSASYAVVAIFSGLAVALIGYFSKNMIAKKLPAEKLNLFITNEGFIYVGIIIILIGIAFIVLNIISRKIDKNRKSNTAIKTTSVEVPDSQTLEVMGSLGMFNNMIGDMKGESKIVDYYGDGRGLKEQKEWQKSHSKEKNEEKKS